MKIEREKVNLKDRRENKGIKKSGKEKKEENSGGKWRGMK